MYEFGTLIAKGLENDKKVSTKKSENIFVNMFKSSK